MDKQIPVVTIQKSSPIIPAILSLLLLLSLLTTAYIMFQTMQLKQQIKILTEQQSVPTAQESASCEYNGVLYANGEGFQNDCNSCSCENGQVACTAMACE